MTVAFYAGSFDPVTVGHMDVIERAVRILSGSTLILAVGTHHEKRGFMSVSERMDALRSATRGFSSVEVDSFSGLVIDAARKRGANILVRGIRSVGDVEDELRMARMNSEMASEIETIFIASSSSVSHVSSSLVRQIALMGGDVSSFIPKGVRGTSSPAKKRGDRGESPRRR